MRKNKHAKCDEALRQAMYEAYAQGHKDGVERGRRAERDVVADRVILESGGRFYVLEIGDTVGTTFISGKTVSCAMKVVAFERVGT